jgi:hypothetical protein
MDIKWDGSINIVSLIEFGALLFGILKIYKQQVETQLKVETMWRKYVGENE